MREEIAAGATATIAIRISVDGVPSTGAASTRIQRASDGKWLDADDTFKAFASVGTLTRALVADANDVGRYAYAWNTGAVVNATANDTYFATIDVTAPYAYSVTGEISATLIPAVQSGLATSSALAAVASTLAGLATTSALAAVSTIATTIRKRLTNRRKLAADGTETLYDDDATTAIATRVYTDVTGGAVTINAGEPARATAET